ncbi:polysaccharide deacetylase family protein [Flavobacterium sp. UBA6135]|uniref:polysaccharide deacetylase family protein n=1 Tax=Flavobacterium sp. UBA6135 TaxID=1946553 RepID=UPI0025C362B7|nr:polysaccharide deacetylase family protein [Flavobacterium sp. UBA6135]
MKTKKIVLIWDFDGPIGQVNSTLPYNFHFEQFEKEINNVRWLLEFLKEEKIKCCFAITGFSAEIGVYPYTFPELIQEIAANGHEVASHSWKHEWIPLFTEDQINKSLKRSKKALEQSIAKEGFVTGFVPPHNRPMTWWQKGAFSLGDRGLFPFFTMGNMEALLQLLVKNKYQWVRISYKNLFTKFRLTKKNITGRIYNHKGIFVLENHYNGFDDQVIQHILTTNYETYTVSAHPFMLSLANKKESKETFLNFIAKLKHSGQSIEFISPSDYISSINVIK